MTPIVENFVQHEARKLLINAERQARVAQSQEDLADWERKEQEIQSAQRKRIGLADGAAQQLNRDLEHAKEILERMSKTACPNCWPQPVENLPGNPFFQGDGHETTGVGFGFFVGSCFVKEITLV